MSQHETPKSLQSFFASLDSGPTDDSKCEIHYACKCVLQKARLAAEMLVAVEKILGLEAGPPAAENQNAVKKAPPDAAHREPPEIKVPSREEAPEKTKMENVTRQNLKLVDENIVLKRRIQNLQRQVNRLHDIMELRAIQKRIEKPDGEQEASESPSIAEILPENEGAAQVIEIDQPANPSESASEPPENLPEKKE
jgi:hypothetical protein